MTLTLNHMSYPPHQNEEEQTHYRVLIVFLFLRKVQKSLLHLNKKWNSCCFYKGSKASASPCICWPALVMCYREVADSHRILQQSLKADGPAGHSSLSLAPKALDAGQAGIAVQTVVTAAALQLHAVQFWFRTITHTDKSTLNQTLYYCDISVSVFPMDM